jgi:hypothetical protein
MENESIGKRGIGINYKGSQGQTKRAVVLQEEEVYGKKGYRITAQTHFYTYTVFLSINLDVG